MYLKFNILSTDRKKIKFGRDFYSVRNRFEKQN